MLSSSLLQGYLQYLGTGLVEQKQETPLSSQSQTENLLKNVEITRLSFSPFFEMINEGKKNY